METGTGEESKWITSEEKKGRDCTFTREGIKYDTRRGRTFGAVGKRFCTVS